MTGWTLFLTIVGVAFLTAQLFRLIDLIERPTHRPADCRLPEPWLPRVLPPARAAKLLPALRQFARRKKPWTFWKS